MTGAIMETPMAIDEDRLRALATEWGIAEEFYDMFGNRRRPSLETCRAFLQAMGCDLENPGAPPPSSVMIVHAGMAAAAPSPGELILEGGAVLHVEDHFPPDLPVGYHQFRPHGAEAMNWVFVRPATCFLPPDLRIWGWAVQLYATRSEQSWGTGDLADLRRLARWSKGLGAGMIMLNPLGAAAPVLPQQPSPYYPTSRSYRNPLYINVLEAPGAEAAGLDWEALAAAGQALNGGNRIDRDSIFRLKMDALEQIWKSQSEPAGLNRYRDEQGESLTTFAVYCALAERYGGDWRAWPAEFHHPHAPAVVRFALDHAPRVQFHQWLQWVLHRQLAEAAAEAPLVHDLPIGVDPGGADSWAWQDTLALNASVGAPPDQFNADGQNWGLPPFAPQRLQAAGYRPLIEMLRATFQHSGGVRIDHVMGLFRLYWIPQGESADAGTYVRYPADELLAVLAIESHRAGAWVAGEDLGTVEPGVRERLQAENILSHRLLWFEPAPPREYPWQSIAAVNTHDLPTVAGLWSGADVAAQRSVGFHPNDSDYEEIRNRVRGMAGLGEQAPLDEVIVAAHRLLGQSPSAVVCASLADALAVEERPNMPGTIDQWPNWSIPLPLPLERIETEPLCARLAEALART